MLGSNVKRILVAVCSFIGLAILLLEFNESGVVKKWIGRTANPLFMESVMHCLATAKSKQVRVLGIVNQSPTVASYSSETKTFAKRIASKLRKAGYEVIVFDRRYESGAVIFPGVKIHPASTSLPTIYVGHNSLESIEADPTCPQAEIRLGFDAIDVSGLQFDWSSQSWIIDGYVNIGEDASDRPGTFVFGMGMWSPDNMYPQPVIGIFNDDISEML